MAQKIAVNLCDAICSGELAELPVGASETHVNQFLPAGDLTRWPDGVGFVYGDVGLIFVVVEGTRYLYHAEVNLAGSAKSAIKGGKVFDIDADFIRKGMRIYKFILSLIDRRIRFSFSPCAGETYLYIDVNNCSRVRFERIKGIYRITKILLYFGDSGKVMPWDK